MVGLGKGKDKMKTFITSFWNDESGISSVEYALLLAFVAAGVITAAGTLSTAVENEMTGAANCISTGQNC
jgi:Flp pilus assembly pilin Flp